MKALAPPRMLEIMRSEYREMPELRLTVAQASRLWSLDKCEAEALLEELVRCGFLVRDAARTYARWDAVTVEFSV